MSPRVADPALRTALVETAARLLAHHGPSGLTLRRLADEVGTSTMAVYTHFGGMANLLGAVLEEGFQRFRVELGAVQPSEDPVADLVRMLWAYRDNAVANPHLYRAMFMATEPPPEGVGEDTFEVLVDALDRCVVAGRFTPADARLLAQQTWSVLHGVMSLGLSMLLTADEVEETLDALVRGLCTAFGDEPSATARSFDLATRERQRQASAGRSGA